jgi:hypothetical protein
MADIFRPDIKNGCYALAAGQLLTKPTRRLLLLILGCHWHDLRLRLRLAGCPSWLSLSLSKRLAIEDGRFSIDLLVG